ncbi:MAG: hypothetical protein SGARI_001176, partial [Bacillariaceae sp.]
MTQRKVEQARDVVVTTVQTVDEASSSSAIDLEGKEVGRGLQVEAVPPKSLVLIWILMAAELGFDLVTTIIAFIATLGQQECCGHTIYLGPLPLTTTVPFFLLILAELSFLGRAILLTLWPSIFGNDVDDSDAGSTDDDEGFEVKLSHPEAEKDDDDDGNNSEESETQLGDAVKVSVRHENYKDEVEEVTARDKSEKKGCCSLRQ